MRWLLAPGVRWLEVDHSLVLHRRTPPGFVELDAAGTEMWLVLDACDFDAAAAATLLAADFDLDPEAALDAVRGFAEQMAELQLLTPTSPVTTG